MSSKGSRHRNLTPQSRMLHSWHRSLAVPVILLRFALKYALRREDRMYVRVWDL